MAASICAALIKSIFLIIERGESIWLPRLEVVATSMQISVYYINGNVNIWGIA